MRAPASFLRHLRHLRHSGRTEIAGCDAPKARTTSVRWLGAIVPVRQPRTVFPGYMNSLLTRTRWRGIGSSRWCSLPGSFQRQRASGYSLRPRSGPGMASGTGSHAIFVPGATSPWLFTAAPFRGPGVELRESRTRPIVPGATNPWLFTAAPFRAGGYDRRRRLAQNHLLRSASSWTLREFGVRVRPPEGVEVNSQAARAPGMPA